MALINGGSPRERKGQMAELVAQHLTRLGISAEAVKGKPYGFRDQVLVRSAQLGFIHVTYTDRIHEDTRLGDNRMDMTGKNYIAYGWNDGVNTAVYFLPTAYFGGRPCVLDVREIKRASQADLTLLE